jgi:hypothetical protein
MLKIDGAVYESGEAWIAERRARCHRCPTFSLATTIEIIRKKEVACCRNCSDALLVTGYFPCA